MAALDRVLRLPCVCSKRFLTTKVDRSVTGLDRAAAVRRPAADPLADVAVISQTHFGTTGGATSIGEQPIKGLVDPGAMARVSLGESLTNLVFACTSGLRDVKYSGNWMYAAKLPGDGAHMYDACDALVRRDERRLAWRSTAARTRCPWPRSAGGEVVKAPGSLVMSWYVTVPDITKTVTPDLKLPGSGKLFLVEFASAAGRRRLGGSALAQAYDQMGDVAPDMDDRAYFKAAWETTQDLVTERKISAGHDVSDGGVVVALAEMAFPRPDVGVNATLPRGSGDDDSDDSDLAAMFAEELAIILEIAPDDVDHVAKAYAAAGVTCRAIGDVTDDGMSPSPSPTAARRSSRARSRTSATRGSTRASFSSACNPPRPRSRRSRVG